MWVLGICGLDFGLGLKVKPDSIILWGIANYLIELKQNAFYFILLYETMVIPKISFFKICMNQNMNRNIYEWCERESAGKVSGAQCRPLT